MQTTDRETKRSQVLAIEGMSCGSCARNVERALTRAPGVERATVDLAGGRATVDGTATIDSLVAAVEAAGYGAKPVNGDVNRGGSDERRNSGCCR